MSKKKWGDKIPEVRPNGDGTDSWYICGERQYGTHAVCTVHGAMPDRTNPPQRWADVPAKAYVPAERVKAMDEDGVDVHTFFGNVAGDTFSRPEYDEEFRRDAIHAFQIEECAEPYPGRFITLAIVPLWDVYQAVAEVKRMLQRGVKGVSFAMAAAVRLPPRRGPLLEPAVGAARRVAPVAESAHRRRRVSGRWSHGGRRLRRPQPDASSSPTVRPRASRPTPRSWSASPGS